MAEREGLPAIRFVSMCYRPTTSALVPIQCTDSLSIIPGAPSLRLQPKPLGDVVLRPPTWHFVSPRQIVHRGISARGYDYRRPRSIDHYSPAPNGSVREALISTRLSSSRANLVGCLPLSGVYSSCSPPNLQLQELKFTASSRSRVASTALQAPSTDTTWSSSRRNTCDPHRQEQPGLLPPSSEGL